MAITGKQDFTGGITRRKRVSWADRAILSKLDGYWVKDGVLVGEGMVDLLNTFTDPHVPGVNVSEAPVPEQMPFAFREAGSTILIARDGTDTIREFETRIAVVSMSGAAAGTGYTVGDVLTLAGGTGGTVTVTSISGGGATGPVTGVSLTTGGYGYSVGVKATTGGTGAGNCTVNVTSVAKAWDDPAGNPDLPDVPDDAVPIRLGSDQVIFPTVGSDAKLMVYEPRSPTTKLRPLGFKGPCDYAASEKPIVTASASAALQLFDCNDAETDWVAVEEGVTPTTTADAVVIVIDSTSDANSVLAKKDLGAVGVSPTGKSYLVFDIAIENDEQNYTYAGLFPNDATMYPSGYIFELYSDQACAALIAAYYIPKCTQEGLVYRFAINIGTLTTTIKGIAIKTAAFWDFPTGDPFTIRLWSEPFAAAGDWSQKGNFLLPAVAWNKGGWAAILAQTGTGVTGYLDVPPTGNLLTKGDFEPTCTWNTHWVRNDTGQVTLQTASARSGSYGVSLHGSDAHTHNITSGSSAGAGTSIEPGREYCLELYYRKPSGSDVSWRVEIVQHSAAHAVLETNSWPSGATWYAASLTDFVKFLSHFSANAAANHCHVVITVGIATPERLLDCDDIAIYPANQASSNCTYLLQTFSQGGTNQTPGNPYVRYAYGFRGKDRLSVVVYDPMVSNPSNESDSLFADPWRTYANAITLPGTTDVMDDYGDYVTHFVIYRSIYMPLEAEGAGAWGNWDFIKSLTIGATGTYTDAGVDDPALVDGFAVPAIMETRNDPPSSARYLAYLNGRVYAFGLDWNETDGVWKRVLWGEVSSQGKPWAFPTTVDADSLVTDGVEISCPVVTGSEIRGCIVVGDDIFVYTDMEYFVLRGDNPLTGWRWIRVDDVGLASNRSLASRRGVLIGLAPDNYFYRYTTAGAINISKERIDITDIYGMSVDLTKPHNAVMWRDEYIFFASNQSGMLLKCDLTETAWRIRTTAALLNCVGISTDGVDVFGLTNELNVAAPYAAALDLFGSLTADGLLANTTRTIASQYIQVGPLGRDVQVDHALFEVDGSDGEAVGLTYGILGKEANAVVAGTGFTTDASITRYEPKIGQWAEAIKITVSYVGVAPPDIHGFGLNYDVKVVR